MIDLDIDVGADTVDYQYVPLRSPLFACPVHLPSPASSPIKSLSGLETVMHKLEGLVKEIMDEKRASRSEESP